jgi:3-oxoacyl-[acyl-carrier protein] reductase
MDLGLGGKRVLITGGSRGIGFACARAFLGEGADVVIAARDPARLEAAKKDLTQRAQGKVEALELDMSTPGAAAKLADAYPTADILVNNAGAIPGGDLLAIDEAKWRAAWDLKVFGYVNMCRRFYALMRGRGHGVIVNVIGAAGESPDADYIAGSAGNASLMSFTRALGGAAPADGLRVVGINPGPILTDRLETLLRRRAQDTLGDAERWRETMAAMPFGRAGRVEEVAALVAFLASDLSGYTSGTIVTVDGGAASRRKAF